jgi:hypothetical protein
MLVLALTRQGKALFFKLIFYINFKGEPPRDPRRGFLPPNNGTTGQGHVTFSVRVKSSVKPLTRIDAQASIIFDRNEPIDTPPIFNTVR